MKQDVQRKKKERKGLYNSAPESGHAMNFLMYLTLLGLLLFLLKPCQVEESRERAVVALANRQQKMHTSSSQSLVRKKKGGGGVSCDYDGGGSNGSSGWQWWRGKKREETRKQGEGE